MSARHQEQEFDDEPEDEYEEEYESSGSKIVPATVLLIALAGFVSLGWYAYQAGSTSVQDEDILVVEADNTPTKEAPLDPGGMQFPHQDKSVFETISSAPGAVDKPAEKLMPESEQPVAIENAAPAAAETPSAPATAETVQMQPAPAPAPVAAAPVETPQEVPSVSVSAIPGEKVEVPAPKVVKKAAAAKPVAKAKAGSGVVQLGAFKSEAEAQAAWKKLSKHPTLSGKGHSVLKADLGDKGVFYRLRASGVDAKSTCAALAGKTACMPVK